MKIDSNNHDLVIQSLTGAFATTHLDAYTGVEFEPVIGDTIVINVIGSQPKQEETDNVNQEETNNKSQEESV